MCNVWFKLCFFAEGDGPKWVPSKQKREVMPGLPNIIFYRATFDKTKEELSKISTIYLISDILLIFDIKMLGS